MADLSKIKRRLPSPPKLDEASTNLREPETAPARKPAKGKEPPRPAAPIDGRSLRRTGRTVQFATRVTEDFANKFRAVAMRDGVLMNELLELTLAAYEAQQKPKRR